MSVDVIVGLQRGDEGKGRFTDALAQAINYDGVARFNGGANAGHKIVLPDGETLSVHSVPSGIAHEGVTNIIGNGTLVDPEKLVKEIDDIRSHSLEVSEKNLMISEGAHLILPHHIFGDMIREAGNGAQGSTKAGIAQAASDKALRVGARVEMIRDDPDGLLEVVYESLKAQAPLRQKAALATTNERLRDALATVDERFVANKYIKSAMQIGQYVTDTMRYLNEQLRKDPPAKILAEGAQAFLLDIDHGMYPFTTSTSTTAGGVCTGLGIAPRYVGHTTGIAKAVQSHVGGGPFVTEIKDPELMEQLHGDMTTIDAEIGTTTGRMRRLGHLDLPGIRRAQMVNGTDEWALTKLDWVPRFGKTIHVCVAYSLDGQEVTMAPSSAAELERAKPIYAELPNWTEDISGIREFGDLPRNAQKYIQFLEDQTGVPLTMIGVGPAGDQVIKR